MSFQKKSLILHELEQAIKKKAQQKSRNKDAMSRVIQGSIQKKKNILKTATNKDNRIASIHKNSQTASKQNLPDKPVSIFNNEHLTVFESTQFKAKKYNNRRLDKLVSLIQYMISSSEKALRYISSTNFQAEFALKLYKSDRENLANQLKNLNFDDIMDSQRYSEHKGGKQDQTFNVLLEENNQLKKEILILQKQAESYHNKLKDGESAQIKHLEKESSKLKEMLRKIIPFDNFKHILEILQKENKFEIMSLKCQQNSKKTTQIQIVISSLENQRANIIENLSKLKDRNDKHYKLSQIQGEKQQLQKELNNMKVKLSEIIDSGKSLSQLEMVKKNSELITQKLLGLAKELNPNTQMKRNNEQLIDHIKNVALLLLSKNNQLSQAVSRFVQQNQSLKRQLKELNSQKKELQNEEQDIRMLNMLSQIQKLRDVVDELDLQQQRSAEKIKQLKDELNSKEGEIARLNAELSKQAAKGWDMQQIMNQVKDEMQTLTHKLEDKEKSYRDKIAKMEQINKQLSTQISEISEENQQLRNNIEELIRRNDSRGDSKLLFSEKAQISYQDLDTKLEKNQANFERELKAKRQQIEILQEEIHQYKMLQTEIMQNKEANHKKITKLQKNQTDLIQQLAQLQSQLDRMRKEYAAVTQKLRITQNEIISNNYSKDQLKFSQAEKQNLTKRLQAANSEISELKDQIKEVQDELQDKDLLISELQMKLDESKASNKKIQMGDIQTTRQLNTFKQQLEFLGKEKESKEKLMQQQRQRHISEYESLNNKLHEAELLNIQLLKEKVQVEEQLEMQRENNDSLKHKIEILQDEVTELQDEIKSLTLLSNQAQGERQRSRELLNNLEQERQSLKKEVNNTKQQITQHLELVQFKNKQYVNLLRQILKGLELDPLDYKDLNTFEELLEFGSQQVVQLRKRQREEQSNKRKNSKKQYQGQLSEFYQPCFEDCKAKLFQDNSVSKPFEKKEAQVEDKINLQQFGELQEKSNNNSMVSEENHNGAELQEFNDLQSQKMNESLISNGLDEKLPDDIGLHSYPKFQEEEVSRLKQIEGKLQQMEKSQVQEENLSQVEGNLTSSQHGQQKEEDKQKEMVRSNVQAYEEVNEYMIQSYTPVNNSGSLKMDNYSIFFHGANLKIPEKKQKIQPQNRAYSKHTLLSIALKDQKLDLDEFQEVKSMNDNQSFVSSSDIRDRQVEFGKEDKSQGEIDENQVQQYPLKVQEKHENEMNLQEFKEVEEEALSQSMLSEKWQHQQVNIQDFGELAQSGLRDSMISANQQKDAEGQAHMPVHLGLEEFGEVDEKMNDSMLSQKREQHGLSEFGQYGLDRLNESLQSEKEGKEHGMSQFGEIQDDKMSDSIFSDNLNNLMQSNHSGGANFDEFDELKSQKMSESMLSLNQASPFTQKDEAESSPKKQLY